MVTIRDVAKESGFSSTTVSIVLNNAPLARYIPATTKKRIERAAQRNWVTGQTFLRAPCAASAATRLASWLWDMADHSAR